MRRALAPIPLLVATAVAGVLAPPLVAFIAGDLGQRRLLSSLGLGAVGSALLGHLPSVPGRGERALMRSDQGSAREGGIMTEPGKITAKAAELAAQAAAAAGPLKDKAAELAGTAAAAAGPIASQAKDRAAELAERAAELGAKGVSALAESIDKVTGGKYSDKISSVTSKLEEKLDPDKPES